MQKSESCWYRYVRINLIWIQFVVEWLIRTWRQVSRGKLTPLTCSVLVNCSPEVHWLPKPFFLPISRTVILNADKVLSSHHSGREQVKTRKALIWLKHLTHAPSPRDCLARRGFLSLKGFRQYSSQHGPGVPERRVLKCIREKLKTHRHVYRVSWTLHKLLHLVPVEFPME